MILALEASGSGSLFIYKSVKNSPFAIRKIQTMEFIAETIADLSPSLTLSITSQAKQMREAGPGGSVWADTLSQSTPKTLGSLWHASPTIRWPQKKTFLGPGAP